MNKMSMMEYLLEAFFLHDINVKSVKYNTSLVIFTREKYRIIHNIMIRGLCLF